MPSRLPATASKSGFSADPARFIYPAVLVVLAIAALSPPTVGFHYDGVTWFYWLFLAALLALITRDIQSRRARRAVPAP